MGRITNYLSYHRRGVAWTAFAMLLCLGGGMAVGALTSGSGGSSNASSDQSTTTTASPTAATQSGSGAQAGTKARGHGVVGTIATIGPNSWTITTTRGRTWTVDFTSSTVFSAKVTPSAAAVGDQVVIIGTKSGSTITATKVGPAHRAASSTNGSSSSSHPILTPNT